MIPKKLIPIAAILLTIGFLVSCSSSNPMLDNAQSSMKANNYTAAKSSADKYIKKYPDKPLGYYWKGVALGQQAQDKSKAIPAQATPIYKDMNDAFSTALGNASKADKQPKDLDRIGAIKQSLWRYEHNAAVKFATDDSLKEATDNPLEQASNHLNNAVVIEPDSALSWNVLAQVNGMKKNFKDAAAAQKKYVDLKPNAEPKAYLLLAQYYRYDKNMESEISILQKLQEQHPENVKGVEMLADAYSHNGQSEKSIETVQNLVDKNPSEPRYRRALGTQIYQTTKSLQDSIKSNTDKIFTLRNKQRNASDNEVSQLKEQINQLKEQNANMSDRNSKLTEQALTQIKKVAEATPNDASIFNTLGIIYQNKAAILFDQRNVTRDNAQAKELDNQAKSVLKMAMTNYEKAANLKPENKQYWRSLFQVYTTLGMDKKAKEAEKKAGMN